MPTYDYICSECGRQFQIFHAMSADPPTQCSEARQMAGTDADDPCKGAVKRLLTGGTGLIFKGSGFYITDYKDNPGAKDGAKKEGADGDSKKAADASEKGDSKSEAKSEIKASETSKPTTESKSATTDSKPAASSSSTASS